MPSSAVTTPGVRSELARVNQVLAALVQLQRALKREVDTLLIGQQDLLKALADGGVTKTRSLLNQHPCDENDEVATSGRQQDELTGAAHKESSPLSVVSDREDASTTTDNTSQINMFPDFSTAAGVLFEEPADRADGWLSRKRRQAGDASQHYGFALLRQPQLSFSESQAVESLMQEPITPRSPYIVEHKRKETPGEVGDQSSRSVSSPMRAGTMPLATSLSPNWPETVCIREELVATVPCTLRKELEKSSEVLTHVVHNYRSSPLGSLSLHVPTTKSFEGKALHPGSNIRLFFDMLGVPTLFFDLWVVPFILAWGMDSGGWINLCSWLSIVYWSCDLCLNFITGFHRYGEVEMKIGSIVKHYLQGMFAPDLLILIADIIATSTDHKEGRLLRAAKAGKLIRIFRLARLLNVMDKLERFTVITLPMEIQAMFQVLELLMCIVWVNHLLCCAWWAIGYIGSSDTGLHWVSVEISPYLSETFEDVSVAYQYTTSLHWAMVQMTPGSMEVQPRNSAERSFNILCLIFGIMFFSSLISSLSSVTTHMRIAKAEQLMKVKTLRRFLSQKRIDRRTQLSILRQVTQRFRSSNPLVLKEVTALDHLSDSLKRELHYQMLNGHITRVGFLRLVVAMNMHTAMNLCSRAMEFVVKHEHDDVFFADNIAERAFLISTGTVEYTQEPSSSRVETAVSTPLREGAMLAEATLWTYWTHVGNAVSASMSELILIAAVPFAEVLRTHHSLSQLAADYAGKYHARLVRAYPPHAAWPSDVSVPFTDFREIMLACQKEVKVLVGRLCLEMLKLSWFWKWRVPRRVMDALAAEIEEGLSVLVPSSSCADRESVRVERLVSITAVRLQEDDFVLVELARHIDDRLVPKCQYLGVKQADGEMPSAAFQRLRTTRLAHYEDSIEIISTQQTTTCSESGSYKIKTTYTQTLYVANLSRSREASPARTNRENPKGIIMMEKDMGILCAWLPTSVIKTYQSAAGAEKLKATAEALWQQSAMMLLGM